MKRLFSIINLTLSLCLGTFAQTTISYGQISSFCPQTGQTLGGGGAIAITFYDGYIYHPLYGNLYAAQRNNDGSITYIPQSFAGTPAMQLNAVLVSADRQRMEERITSSLGYASLNMINSYTSMGEDGGRAAQRWSDANAASQRGGSSYSNERSSSSSNYSSERSRSKGICSICGGTGVNPNQSSGGSLSSWIAHFNPNGTQCPYCRRYNSHSHDKCSHCNVPRY
ncbi:MAG: hypothetical protein IJ633_07720 [Prevotella sp.]|nr:hypothetical protein [Prevotella sp.]